MCLLTTGGRRRWARRDATAACDACTGGRPFAHPAVAASPPSLSPSFPRSIWGSPLNVKVAVDVVLLSTGLLSQQMNGGDGGTPPGTPRSGSVRFPASLSPSTAPSVTGDAE